MPKLGSAYVEVRADRKNLKPDLDKAEGQVARSAGSMQAAISKVSFAAVAASAVAMGLAVTRAVSDGVRSFSELERKLLRTESIIKATGNAAGLSSREMLDLANKIDLATLNDRDAVLDAINAMQTFKTVSGDTFKRAIELSVDLSEVLGVDLRSQVVQLGKALEAPKIGLTALRRVGVSFTDAQKDMVYSLVDSNRLLEAQSIILDEIATQVGGSAQGAAGGLAGKTDTLNFRWREFKETLAASVGAIKSVSDSINILTASLKAMTDWMKGDSPAEKLEKEIARIEKAFAKNPDWAGPVAEQLKRRLESARASLAELRDPTNMDVDYGGSPTGGATSGGDSSAKTSAVTKIGNEYIDMWRNVAADRYEVQSRSLQNLIDLEKTAASDIGAEYIDLWRSQGEDRYEVQSRALSAEIELQAEHSKEMIALTERTANAMQENFSNLFYDALTGELSSLADYTDSIFKSIAKAFSDMAGQMVAQGIFGKGFGGGGALSAAGSWLAGLFHDGGIVGAGGALRSVNPMVFAGAPRLHSGLAPDEFPAILQRGERVVPKNQAGSSGVSITQNYDFRGADASMVPQIKAMLARSKADTINAIRQSMRSGGEFYRLTR